MKEWVLKHIVNVAIAITTMIFIIVVINAVHNYLSGPSTTMQQNVRSKDTNYVETHQENFRPSSVPIVEQHHKDPVPLPSDVNQSQVQSTLQIIHTDSAGHKDTTAAVILNNGAVLIPKPKDGETIEVHQYMYIDPILAIGLFPKAGVDGNASAISPVVGAGIVKIYGIVQLPVIGLDLQGVIAGIDVKIYREWSAGPAMHWNWKLEKDFRLMLNYNF